MRKGLIVLSLTILSLSAWCQTPELPVVDNKISYTEVVNIEDASAADLIVKARKWYAKSFNSSNAVIQMDSPEAIVGKALLPVYRKSMHSGAMHYTITVSVKEGKYRYEITDFYHTNASDPTTGWGVIEKMYEPTSSFNRKTFDGFLQQTDSAISSVIASLKEAMVAQDSW